MINPYALFLYIFSYHFLPSLSLNIYVDSTVTTCTQDCGTSPQNPFTYLDVAMITLDQIIENNQNTSTQYPSISNNFNPTNTNITILLSIAGTYDFIYANLTTTRPCNSSVDQCVFPYFLHNFSSLSSITFQPYSPNSTVPISFVTINVNTQRVIFYTNYTLTITFNQIIFNGNNIWSDDCADCGVPSSPYGLFMLWPFAGGQIKSLLTNGQNPKLSFLNCTVENFVVSKLNHSYSFFIGYMEIDPYYYTQDITADMNLIKLLIVLNLCYVNSNYFPTAIFSVQKADFQVYNSTFNASSIYSIMTISDIWNSQTNVTFYNVTFQFSLFVIQSAFNSTINFTNVSFSSITNNNFGAILNFNDSVIVFMEHCTLTQSQIPIFCSFINSSDLTLDTFSVNSVNLTNYLFAFIDNNNVHLSSSIAISLLEINPWENIQNYPNLFYFEQNNNINITVENFTIIYLPSEYLISVFAFSTNNTLYLSNSSIFIFGNFYSIFNLTTNYNNFVINQANVNYLNGTITPSMNLLTIFGNATQANLSYVNISSTNNISLSAFISCYSECSLDVENINLDFSLIQWESLIDLYDFNSNLTVQNFILFNSSNTNFAFTAGTFINYTNSIQLLSVNSTNINLNNNSFQNYFVNSLGYLSQCNITNNQCSIYCVPGLFTDLHNFCQLCDDECLTCVNQSYICPSCKSNYYLTSNSRCVLNCPLNSYVDYVNKLCILCDSQCNTCSTVSSNCTSCNISLYLNNNNQCVSDCPNNQFKHLVDQRCYTICPTGYYGNLLNYTCLQNCPDYAFLDIVNKVCGLCDSTCTTCFNASYNCTSCNKSLFLTDNNTCLPNCLNNEFKHLVDNKCYDICPNGYYGNFFNFTCVVNCTDENGMFRDENDNLCDFCIFDCKTCISENYNCLICKYDWLSAIPYCQESENSVIVIDENLFNSESLSDEDVLNSNWLISSPLSNGTNVSTCAIFTMVGGIGIFGQNTKLTKQFSDLDPHFKIRVYFYFIKIDHWTNNNLLIYADSNNVFNMSFNDMTTFNDQICGNEQYPENISQIDFVFSHSNSVLNIEITTDLNSNLGSWGVFNFSLSSYLCDKTCATCSDNSPYNCLICVIGYYFETDNSCQRCNVLKCPFNCNSTQVIYDYTCVSNCPDNYYLGRNKTCLVCDDSCETCSGPSNTSCLTCPNTAFLYQGSCLETCPEQTFTNLKERVCSSCDHTCYSCIGPDPNECLSCENQTRNFTPNSNTSSIGSCLCDSGFYDDSVSVYCFDCHYTCQECYGPDFDNCIQCPETRGNLPNNTPSFEECPCALNLVNYHQKMCLDGSKDPVVIVFESSTQAAFYASLMGLVSLPFAGLLSVFFKFIEVAQELILILYFNIELPLNLKNMLDFLKNYELSFLLPFFFHHKSDNQLGQNKFAQNNLSSLFVDNSLTLIFLICGLPWLLFILFFSVKKFFNLEQKFKKFESMFEYMKNFLKYNLIFLLFQNSTQEMSLFFALQLRYFSLSTEIQILSSLACLFFFVLDLLMIFWLFLNTKLIVIENYYSVQKEFQSIFENIDISRKYTLYYPIAKAIKKLLLSFFVVFLYDYVEVLALCLIMLSALMYIFYRIIEPFESKYRNIICEVTEFLQCCIYALLFLYSTCRLESTDSTALYIGYMIIILVMMLILLNFGMLMLNLFSGFFIFICKFNKLREAIQLGDLISRKIGSIKMKEFTYEKIWKDPTTGLLYKQAMFNRLYTSYRDKATQYEPNFKQIEKKSKTINKKVEKNFELDETDNSLRKLKEDEIEMRIIHEQVIEEKREDFFNKKNIHNEDQLQKGEIENQEPPLKNEIFHIEDKINKGEQSKNKL